MSDSSLDLPEAAVRRLESSAFSSGLTVPDFAACLDLGLQPVGLVQGFCVMRWGWYGSGSGYMRGLNPYAAGPQTTVATRRRIGAPTATCRTSIGCGARTWSRPGSKRRGPRGYLGLRSDAGRGTVDRRPRSDRRGGPGDQPGRHGNDRVPFHGHRDQGRGRPAPGGRGAVDHLSGGSAADQVHRGGIHAGGRRGHHGLGEGVGLLHDRVPDGGKPGWGGPTSPYEVEQVSKAHMAVRQLARKQVRQQLMGDTLHGARSRSSIASFRRATRSLTAPCGETACGASRTSTWCPPAPTVRLT